MKHNYFDYILSIPKSLVLCIKYFRFKDAVRLPILVHYKTKFIDTGGVIEIPEDFYPGMIKVGFGYMNYPTKTSSIKIGGVVTFKGKASFLNGIDLNLMGIVEFGKNFICNPDCKIDAKKEMVFGDDVLIGPCCYFTDDDGHSILEDDERINPPCPIFIGSHVWFGRGVYVLKGSSIEDESVVGAKSLVASKFNEKRICIAGNPAKKSRKMLFGGFNN